MSKAGRSRPEHAGIIFVLAAGEDEDAAGGRKTLSKDCEQGFDRSEVVGDVENDGRSERRLARCGHRSG